MIQTLLVCGVAWLLGDSAASGACTPRRSRSAPDARARAQTERPGWPCSRSERIARELHDAVAHHVSVVVIQAGAGLRALGSRPDDARSALRPSTRAGRQALTDMRRMLAMLGDETGCRCPGSIGSVTCSRRFARPDWRSSCRSRVNAPTLEPELEASAYRIIQESLTNSLKHAGGRGRARHRPVRADRGLGLGRR